MRKLITLVLVCLAIMSLSGCSADRNTIYGDDTKIAKSADSSLSQMSVYNRSDNNFTMTAQAFTGAKTIWSYNAKEEGDVAFLYTLSVSEGGKAKLVHITPDDEVVILTENADNTVTDETQAQTVSLKKGKHRIKIVGCDDPKLTLMLSVDVGELVSK